MSTVVRALSSVICKMGLSQPTGLEDVRAYRLRSTRQWERERLGIDSCRAAPALQ